MAYEIIWTAEASTDLLAIANYLKDNWSQTSADKFIENVIARIEKLSKMPSLARSTKKENHFMYKLDKKNVLFFSKDNNKIILLSIYPYKKDITKSKYY
jgi:plasmid stabilization system protein ParE